MALPGASAGGPAPRAARGAAVASLAVALAACVVAVAVGGAATPVVEGLTDVGPVVRWGLPLLRVVHDGSASLTIGLLVVAAFLLPGGSARRTPAVVLRAARWAVASGVVWVIAGLLGVVLGFADAAGTPLTDGQFWAQFQQFAWSLETLRVGLISSAVAAVAVTVAAFAVRRTGIAAAAFVALGALLPLALAGHASGSSDHEAAVNTIAVHLVAAALWVGGLLAVLVLRPLIGRSLPVVVSRFSTLALWCFVAVAVSGVAGAAVRLGGTAALANLDTAYGALVLVKTGALVALGLLGLQQRRRVVARMAVDGPGRALFVRFAVVETLVMGVAFGFATALARSAPPDLGDRTVATPVESLTSYPAPAEPTATTWLTLWRFDWLWGVVAVVAVGVYLAWVLRLRRRGDSWSPFATASWVLGWVVMAWATCGAAGVLGRVSFSWHMIEHMVIAMFVPTLLVLGAPISLALRALPARTDGSIGLRELVLGVVHSRVMRVFANPVVAAALFFFSLAIFYYTPLFSLSLTTHTGHVLMVGHFLATGYLFAWVLVGRDPGPPKWAPSLRLLILLVTVSFHAFFGVALMTATTSLAPAFFGQVGIPWIPDVIADQQLGGSIAWAVGELPTLILAMFVVRDWVRTDSALAKRQDRQADRDGDAELAAYNERLHSLSQRGRPSSS